MEGLYEVLPRAETSLGNAVCEIQFFHQGGSGGHKSMLRKPDKKKEKQLRKGPGVSFKSAKGQETPTAVIGMKKGKSKRALTVNFGGLYATKIPPKEKHECEKKGGKGLGGLFGKKQGGGGHPCHHGHTHGPLGSVFGTLTGLMRSLVHHDHHSDMFHHHRHNFSNRHGAHKHHDFVW